MGANPEPRLLVDSTAGRLARWLRLLGFDAEYAGGRIKVCPHAGAGKRLGQRTIQGFGTNWRCKTRPEFRIRVLNGGLRELAGL